MGDNYYVLTPISWYELYSEIENKKEYEFLRGNKELESIFEEHLK